jgi:CheY-like chemotaxis protein
MRLDNLRILFVDDQPDARDMFTELFELYGAKVTAVDCAAQALASITAQSFDVLVSDIGLPNEDGYSLIRRIRTLPADQGGRVPAVAVTGFARAEDGRRALAEGFQNHLSKPVEPMELLALVASLAGRAG